MLFCRELSKLEDPMGTTNENKVYEEIGKILKENYLPYAKVSIIKYEQEEGKLSDRAVYELRDAFDHLAIATSAGRTPEEIQADFNAAKEHIRRISVEPLEYLAEERLKRICKIRKYGIWWWRLLLIKVTPELDLDKNINKIIELLAAGRINKGVNLEKSFENMMEAFILSKAILDKIRPAELGSRIFAIILLFLGFVLSRIGSIVSWIIDLFKNLK